MLSVCVQEYYSWKKCHKILSQFAMSSLGVPLPSHLTQILHVDLGWEDIQVTSLTIIDGHICQHHSCVCL